MLSGDAILARVDPQQKLRIVTLLRGVGEIVVVTGDGINDAPALRAADVGVAMGRRGTEVAKQAADIVLGDDNFATIVAAIEEGRSIKANIRRFVSYVFTSNVAELAPFLLYIFLPVPLPLTVAQVLAIDLGTDLLPALALGAEPPSARIIDRPPEPPRRPLLTRALALRTFLFFGVLEAALGLVAFFGYYLAAGWRPFASLDPYHAIEREAVTLTFLGIVAGQVGCLFAQRDGPLRARLSLRTNRLIGWGLAFELTMALVLVYVPGLNRLFSMAPVAWPWLLVLPAGAAAFILLDLARRRLERESVGFAISVNLSANEESWVAANGSGSKRWFACARHGTPDARRSTQQSPALVVVTLSFETSCVTPPQPGSTRPRARSGATHRGRSARREARTASAGSRARRRGRAPPRPCPGRAAGSRRGSSGRANATPNGHYRPERPGTGPGWSMPRSAPRVKDAPWESSHQNNASIPTPITTAERPIRSQISRETIPS